MKQILFWIGTVVIALACNGLIYQKEQTLTHGRQVFLKLAPVDPRSLMQGDYMRLAYELAGHLKADDITLDGRLIVQLDAQGIGTSARLEDDLPLAPNETLLIYRNRKGLRLGAESFFFQEGQAAVYEKAKYGELRVDASGNSVLVGLRGQALEPLGGP